MLPVQNVNVTSVRMAHLAIKLSSSSLFHQGAVAVMGLIRFIILYYLFIYLFIRTYRTTYQYNPA